MKTLLTIFSLTLLLSCTQNQENISKTEDPHPFQKDSSTKTFFNFQEKTNNEFESFPAWLLQLYPDSIFNEFQSFTQQIIDFKKVNDSISYALTSVSDFTCQWTYLTILNYRNKTDSTEIAKNCDQDLAYYQYDFKTYEKINRYTFNLTSIICEVPDSLTKDNWVIADHDFYDVATCDTNSLIITVDQRGRIIKEKS